MAGPLHKKTRAPGAMATPAGPTPAAEDGSLQGKWCGTINSGIWPQCKWCGTMNSGIWPQGKWCGTMNSRIWPQGKRCGTMNSRIWPSGVGL